MAANRKVTSQSNPAGRPLVPIKDTFADTSKGGYPENAIQRKIRLYRRKALRELRLVISLHGWESERIGNRWYFCWFGVRETKEVFVRSMQKLPLILRPVCRSMTVERVDCPSRPCRRRVSMNPDGTIRSNLCDIHLAETTTKPSFIRAKSLPPRKAFLWRKRAADRVKLWQWCRENIPETFPLPAPAENSTPLSAGAAESSQPSGGATDLCATVSPRR